LARRARSERHGRGTAAHQAPIRANGGRFLYEFAVPDAGTFWYHPHLGSPSRWGGVCTARSSSRRATRQPWTATSCGCSATGGWIARTHRRGFRQLHGCEPRRRIGNSVTVNGGIRESFELRSGERVRLRLINAANARIFGLNFRGTTRSSSRSTPAGDGAPAGRRARRARAFDARRRSRRRNGEPEVRTP